MRPASCTYCSASRPSLVSSARAAACLQTHLASGALCPVDCCSRLPVALSDAARAGAVFHSAAIDKHLSCKPCTKAECRRVHVALTAQPGSANFGPGRHSLWADRSSSASGADLPAAGSQVCRCSDPVPLSAAHHICMHTCCVPAHYCFWQLVYNPILATRQNH